MNELISIIIPVYNVGKYLGKCLDSVINQTYHNIEIICVNDGSTDNSYDILLEYAKKDSRIKVINQKNAGVSAARNTGLDTAAGKYIMFIDSDDWVDDNICEELYTALYKNKSDASMCCYAREFKDHSLNSEIFGDDYAFTGNSFKEEFFARLIGVKDSGLTEPQNSDALISPCMQLFIREKIADIRFEDIKNIGTSEDWLFQIEVYQKCNSITYINKPLYHYRKTNEGSITTKYKADLFEKWTNLYNKVFALLKNNEMYCVYEKYVNNKIAVTVLFLGLNEIKSDKGILAQSRRLKEILKNPRYEKAYAQLTMKYFPVHWRVFFGLAKHKCTLLMVCMLNVIEFLRTHRR